MNEEYLPPASEAPSHIPVVKGNAIEKPWLRVQCADCTQEKGMFGTHEDMMRLLEFNGWRVGRDIFCPECAKERAREFVRQNK